MSIAGGRSNRGDIYQRYIAMDLTLTVLNDPDYEWIEVDSVTYEVDDIVVGKSDGSLICCQCKKNQPNFRAWSTTELSNELQKTCKLLNQHKNINIRFYSRDSFGDLAKLREYSNEAPNEMAYNRKLPKNLQEVNQFISTQICQHAPHLTSYEFITRISFETSNNFSSLEQNLRERLRNMVISSATVYDALWQHLDILGAHMGSDGIIPQHRLTKSDLKNIVQKAGGFFAQPIDVEIVKSSFARTSAIGRSWKRDIAEKQLPISVLNNLLTAIDKKHKSILLTGLPGSGKTCVMLSLQDELERRARIDPSITPLFIQSREFADFATAEERNAQGLPDQWVEYAARLAENTHVVVVIDSLDVLSIAREHKVLSYFLAQIDRLLKIANVTVVTACRDFDRNYDRRIAQRQWDCEFECGQLNWESEVKPLLESININVNLIDDATKDLIKNPRELALFAELTKKTDIYNPATSINLAQQYLGSIIKQDPRLGDAALIIIENMATEMLKKRSLSIPQQRASIPDAIKSLLLSLNVIRETQNRELTFGHQTLLDVLIVSGAMRKGVTLNQFINQLPPVPFVRPSIRNFLKQLALGNHREYRKQLRTVLTGKAAFHIRRLVAESLSEQVPQDEDWSLIRELRNNHQEVFQIIYFQSIKVEWLHFWNKHLVPILFEQRNAQGLTQHLHIISRWINEETKVIVDFYDQLLTLDYMDKPNLIGGISLILADNAKKNLCEIVPLFKTMLTLSETEHHFLGKLAAKLVSAEAIDDVILWRYITRDITEDDIIGFRFNNKLHCQSHDLGSNTKDFLYNRMMTSEVLLNLAINSFENWSLKNSSILGIKGKKYSWHFLHETTYDKTHSKSDGHFCNRDENILLDAIEKAINFHAEKQSQWWQKNSERICFNYEGALRYFGICACCNYPQTNLTLIADLLTDRELLESNLSYELGLLIKNSFVYLDSSTQGNVIQTILSTYKEENNNDTWSLRERLKLFSFIPCFMRSPEIQLFIDEYEKTNGILIPAPDILSCGGQVIPPFSFEEFLRISDNNVLKLINHYSEYIKKSDEFLVGGEYEVRQQLSKACSYQPTRFLNILSTHWDNIPPLFRNDIMDGVTTYLSCSFGNLQPDHGWKPIERPEGDKFAIQIINELEIHPEHWHHNKSAASAIKSCSHVINDITNANRLISLSCDFEDFQKENFISGSSDLVTIGINTVIGKIIQAMMNLCNKLLENNKDLPKQLPPMLIRLAQSQHKAHKTLILLELPYLQSKNYDLGWQIFDEVMKDPKDLWKYAETCLYYSYNKHFDKIKPILKQLYNSGKDKELEIWGRISALASLCDLVSHTDLFDDLRAQNSTDAWKGAAQVWTNHENIKQHETQCFICIESSLNAENIHAIIIARKVLQLFCNEDVMQKIPLELVQRCFTILENTPIDRRAELFGIAEWLNKVSQNDPIYALTVAEIYLSYANKASLYIYDSDNNFLQLITRLFAEAEECEETDNGEMLQRVVALQDSLLAQGVSGIDKWLKAAERP